MQINEKALIKKDIQEVVKARNVLIPSIIIPIIFTVVVPVVMLIIAHFIDEDPTSVMKLEQILTKMPKDYQNYTPAQVVLKLMIECMFPGYFLLIPIMCSGVIGASSFVSEREHKTMETLLYTPIKIEKILRSKILGVLYQHTFSAIISAKSKSFQEAQQLSGILMVPIIVLIIVQMIGAIMINTIIVIIFGFLLFGLALLLIDRVAKKIKLEELV